MGDKDQYLTEVTSQNEINQRFDALQANAPKMRISTVKQRKKLLSALLKNVLKYRHEITQALKDDYNRSSIETELADTWVVVKEIKFALKHLDAWLAPERVPTPLPFVGSASAIHYESKGVVLIISPWNFPFNLSFAPLVSAIAGGNTVLLKPSEYTQHATRVISKIVSETFPEDVVAMAFGGAEVAESLLKLPFNHIFFTGSPRVGKLVMKAAAAHLASVTLELGGKTPTIIDANVNLSATAKQVAYSKFSNKGQVCIATDYVYVHKSIEADFYTALKRAIQELYPDMRDYPRLVNIGHTKRVAALIDDARQKGAKVETTINLNVEERFIAPVVLSGITDDMHVAQEELFGPILPVKTFDEISALAPEINRGGKPLAMYIFTNKKAHAEYLINNIPAGAALVNETFIHHFNSYLPFGGINGSGLGKSHGHYGFLEFVNAKSVVRHWLPWRPSSLLLPPYTRFTQFVVNLLIKYF